MTTLNRLRLVLTCCAVLSISSLAAFGQTTAGSPPTTTDRTTTTATTGDREDRNDHSNWGWVGLLGLLGLTGLMRKRDADTYDRTGRAEGPREARV
ncbi:MAG: WGxxGxxG family protein [Chthoniobacterales bacterium]